MDYTGKREVEFTIKWDLKDYFRFNFMHYLQTRSGKFYVFSTIIFITYMLYSFKGQNLLFGAALVLAVGLMNPLTIYSRSKRAFLNNSAMQNEQYYIVNDEGVNVKTESSNEKIKWSQIQMVSELKMYIIVFISSTNAIIIPKKAFSDSLEKIKSLKEIIKANVPEDKIKFKN